MSAGVVTYYHPDHLSARVETNGTGGVTRTFGHYPYGEDWYETGASDKWKFTSYERDGESQLNYAMNRFHSGQYGRFMSMDPLAGSAAAPQSLNRYAYAMNDPVNHIDPTGLLPIPACTFDNTCSGGAGGGGGWMDPASELWGGYDFWDVFALWGDGKVDFQFNEAGGITFDPGIGELLARSTNNGDPDAEANSFPSASTLDMEGRGATGKVLRDLLKILSKADCIKFLKQVIQNATLLAAQQPDASKLDSGGQQVFDTNPYSVLTQVMNAQFINQPGQNPQQGGYDTWALAGPFDFPKTITLYSGYFGASTRVQAQILTHEGTHLIYPFSDTQLAAAAGVPGNSPQQSSSNYEHELEKHCK